jgi:hypothetical protein
MMAADTVQVLADDRSKSSAGKVEGYQSLDFEKGSISFALKHYDPPRNLYSSGKSQALLKKGVLESPRIKRVVREVSCILCHQVHIKLRVYYLGSRRLWYFNPISTG